MSTSNVNGHNAELSRLSDTGLALADGMTDIRNRKVIDRFGVTIGHVDALFIDVHERKVRMLQIRAGGFLGIGERYFLLPVDAITSVTTSFVHVNETLGRIIGAPAYDPKLVDLLPLNDVEPFYGYYGVSPFWDAGYLYPHFPNSSHDFVERDRFIR